MAHYQTLEGSGVSGIQGLLNFPNLDNPLFYQFFLTTIFLVFTSLLFFKQTKREGRAHLLGSMAVAGYLTTAIGAILSALGLISTTQLVIQVVITLVLQVIFLLTSRSN